MSGSQLAGATSSYKWLRRLTIIAIYLLVAAFAAPFVLFVAPDIEVRISPVIGKQSITNVRFANLDGKHILFNWRFTKYKYGRPEYFAWMMYDIRNPSDRYSTEAFVGFDCENSLRTLRGAPPNREDIKDMCIRVPTPLIGNPWIVADGWVEYSLKHPFYTVGQRIPAEPEDWPLITPPKKKPRAE